MSRSLARFGVPTPVSASHPSDAGQPSPMRPHLRLGRESKTRTRQIICSISSVISHDVIGDAPAVRAADGHVVEGVRMCVDQRVEESERAVVRWLELNQDQIIRSCGSVSDRFGD